MRIEEQLLEARDILQKYFPNDPITIELEDHDSSALWLVVHTKRSVREAQESMDAFDNSYWLMVAPFRSFSVRYTHE